MGRLRTLVMLDRPSAPVYRPLSFVVQMLAPRTKIAGIIRPISAMTKKMSFLPVKAPATPPKKNIRVLPRKNAMIVVQTAGLILEKRTKFGVAVPPETNEPMTSAMPPKSVRPPVLFAKIAVMPPPSMVALIMA